MVKAWYMDKSDDDQRLPHMLEPPQHVDLDTLKKRTGVVYYQINVDGHEKKMQAIKDEHGYGYSDLIECSREKLPDYDMKIKAFFKEHLHEDEEIRYIVDGSGYFDVRDVEDRWMRIECVAGDMLILPAGIYHRFTLDTKNYIKAMRLFKGVPVWTPINRPADDHASRVQYLQSMATVQ